MLIIYRIISVSYTHLDVYKRQAECNVFSVLLKFLNFWLLHLLPIALQPVSSPGLLSRLLPGIPAQCLTVPNSSVYHFSAIHCYIVPPPHSRFSNWPFFFWMAPTHFLGLCLLVFAVHALPISMFQFYMVRMFWFLV